MPQVRGKSDQPEKKRRLVAVDASVKVHQNPIAAVHHLPGNLCVAGLVRIPEVPSTEVEKVKNETDSDQKSDLGPSGKRVDAEWESRGIEILSLS